VYVGIDVGADRLHCVGLDATRRITGAWLYSALELEPLVRAVGGAQVVMVDAPAQPSTMPHAEDGTLSSKFRRARCAEIVLGREYGSWVPFVAPTERPSSGWIATGLAIYDALGAAGVTALEVYPHAGFRALAAGRILPKKTTVAGARARVELLTAAGIEEDRLAMWSHDGLDALLGALTAVDYGEGRALRVTCGHDDSAIWLPAS
jgi:predicted nuclease with RNAse H fold